MALDLCFWSAHTLLIKAMCLPSHHHHMCYRSGERACKSSFLLDAHIVSSKSVAPQHQHQHPQYQHQVAFVFALALPSASALLTFSPLFLFPCILFTASRLDTSTAWSRQRSHNRGACANSSSLMQLLPRLINPKCLAKGESRTVQPVPSPGTPQSGH